MDKKRFFLIGIIVVILLIFIFNTCTFNNKKPVAVVHSKLGYEYIINTDGKRVGLISCNPFNKFRIF